MTKPLVTYYGGKQRISSQIVEVIKQIPHLVYTEPFAGGCAVLFKKGVPAVPNKSLYIEAINDKENLIYNLYKVARDNPEELKHKINNTLYSQEDYRKTKEICKKGSTDLIELAWATYFQLNTSMNGKMNAGFMATLKINYANTFANKKLRLNDALSRLEGVYIGSEDGIKFIKRWDSPQTLHYCDPPYPETRQGHYSGYSIKDLKDLIECLDSSKGSFILSNYETDLKIPDNWKKLTIQTSCSATNVMSIKRGKREEILWYCDKSMLADEITKAKMEKVQTYWE